jgi:hypothetical protein
MAPKTSKNRFFLDPFFRLFLTFYFIGSGSLEANERPNRNRPDRPDKVGIGGMPKIFVEHKKVGMNEMSKILIEHKHR